MPDTARPCVSPALASAVSGFAAAAAFEPTLFRLEPELRPDIFREALAPGTGGRLP